jgi:hypothetical protein
VPARRRLLEVAGTETQHRSEEIRAKLLESQPAGIKAFPHYPDAARVVVDEEIPRADLDRDRGDGVLPAAVRQILLIDRRVLT